MPLLVLSRSHPHASLFRGPHLSPNQNQVFRTYRYDVSLFPFPLGLGLGFCFCFFFFVKKPFFVPENGSYSSPFMGRPSCILPELSSFLQISLINPRIFEVFPDLLYFTNLSFSSLDYVCILLDLLPFLIKDVTIVSNTSRVPN